MKKLLIVLASTAFLLSCRSVKNEGFIHEHHAGRDADTLVMVAKSATVDSTDYYRGVTDSLSRELLYVRWKYRDLYVRDSINENRYRTDSVNVKDTTWMQVNPDGSVTYHNYREKNTYSFQQLERYRQQLVRECQAVIDSLIERNEYLQSRYDSILRYKSLADSALMYKARLDSVSGIVKEREKTTIEKRSIWDTLKQMANGVMLFLLIGAVVSAGWHFLRKK